MAAWLPFLKASLPYLSQVITAAAPAFTSKPAAGQSDHVVPRQIAELQAAVKNNAEAVQAMAAQLKNTLEGLDIGVEKLQRELKTAKQVAAGAMVVAVIAIIIALYAVASK